MAGAQAEASMKKKECFIGFWDEESTAPQLKYPGGWYVPRYLPWYVPGYGVSKLL